jgi:hypothetical protein
MNPRPAVSGLRVSLPHDQHGSKDPLLIAVNQEIPGQEGSRSSDSVHLGVTNIWATKVNPSSVQVQRSDWPARPGRS